MCGVTDATPLGLFDFDMMLTQGSACGRNPGLEDIAPLGQGTARRLSHFVSE